MGTMSAGDELARWDCVEGAAGGGGERILVSVRMRPMNAKELERNELSDWECINNTTIIFNSTVPERCMFPTACSFDRVFGPECNTRKVYEEGAKEVALSVVCGINSSIFAYGQTSSGKTYTMTGITEYSMEDIYDYIQKHTQREFVLKFAAMEIYNEAVKDLLSPDSGPLRLLDDPEKGTIVEKLTEEILRDQSHLKELLAFCEAQRQIGETSLNETSSRSHQILRLTVESSAREFLSKDNFSTLSATVNFVDLAGSERASQALTAGNRLKEGCHINRSLLTLGTVIRKLSKGRNGHIPFRDSKLTRILQSTLGGNARTAIICTMSPARSHVEQSRNTLLFASCAKEVSTSAQVNVVMSDKALVKHLQRELAKLENELKFPRLVSQSDVLREKESQIKKMEKEMKELMKQRDLAQSRLEDLLHVVGEDQTSREQEEFDQLSVPDEPIACEEDIYSISDTSGIAYQIPDFNFTSFDMSNGRNAQHEQHLPHSGKRREQYVASPTHSVISTSSLEMIPRQGRTEIGRTKSEDYDHFKEVRRKEQYVASPTHSVIRTRSLEMIPHQERTEIGRTKSEDYDHFKEVRRKEQYVASPTHSVISTRSFEMIPHQERTEIGRTKSEDYDHCKEVRCIEVDGSYTSRNDEYNLLTEESNNLLPLILDENEHDDGLKTKRILLPSKFDKNVNKDDELIIKGSPLSHASNDNYHRGYEPDTKEFLQLLNFDDKNHGNHEHKTKTNMEFDPEEKFQNVPKTTGNLVSTCAVESSPWSALKELPSSRGLVLSRSKSCRATLMTRLSHPWFQEIDENKNTSPNSFLKDASESPRDIQRRRIAALNYDAETDFPLGKSYKASEQSTPGYVIKESIKISCEEGIRSLSNFVEGMKEMAPVQFQKQTMDGQEDEKISNRSTEVGRNLKDVGLDPMLVTSESPSLWPVEFEKKQQEILELWHVCHVSLIHRTYFFLLFKGDPADSIYVEVEHRRLSFLKRSFSGGNLDKAVTGDGHATTLASSVKNLRREREMLRKQMLKKLSAEERQSLYKKWGIAVNSKQRRLQLAQRVWTGTNMEHIRESASLVAKLIGLLEPEQAPKEMFGLNFAPQTTNSRSYSRKHRVSSFM